MDPGPDIIVDECMSSYQGAEMLFHDINTIHVTKIIRKPKPIGMELKCSADGSTGVSLKLEIQEGALVSGTKQYETAPENLPFHSAIVLRLVQQYFGSGRVIKGDAAFTSVKTATEVLKRGLHYQGPLKQCYAGFPKLYFEEWKNNANLERGDSKAVTTAYDINGISRTLIALGWVPKPMMMKYFLSTCGTTIEGPPHEVPRSRRVLNEDGIWETVNVIRATRRPMLVCDTLKNIGKIDLHDRYRQGFLKMEINWPTTKWWHRLFATLLGMDVVDAYLAYSSDYDAAVARAEAPGSKIDFKSFAGMVAHGLIFNVFRPAERVARNPAPIVHMAHPVRKNK